MEDTFPEPPLIAYKPQKNIGDFLIRAKVTPQVIHEKQKNQRYEEVWKKLSFIPLYKRKEKHKIRKLHMEYFRPGRLPIRKPDIFNSI